jgi:DNA-binding CsgD family transcriptional regulator
MLNKSQKRFASLMFACPLQDELRACAISKYRTDITLANIVFHVQIIRESDLNRILAKHDNCFMKRTELRFSEKFKNKIEIDKILTERQIQVIKLICKNYTNNDVAVMLNISHHTVANHRRNAYNKLNVRNIRELKCLISKHNLF